MHHARDFNGFVDHLDESRRHEEKERILEILSSFEGYYSIDLSRKALDGLIDLGRSDPDTQGRMLASIGKLSLNPKPHGFTPVVSKHPYLRIREGRYRAIYKIDYSEKKVYVDIVAPRGKDTYESQEHGFSRQPLLSDRTNDQRTGLMQHSVNETEDFFNPSERSSRLDRFGPPPRRSDDSEVRRVISDLVEIIEELVELDAIQRDTASEAIEMLMHDYRGRGMYNRD